MASFLKKNLVLATGAIAIAIATVAGLVLWLFASGDSIDSEQLHDSRIVRATPELNQSIDNFQKTTTTNASSVSAESLPPVAFTFNKSANLWDLATRAAVSSDKRMQLEGLFALRECSGLLKIQHDLKEKIQAVEINRAKMDEALDELVSRCKGFAMADKRNIDAVSRVLEEYALNNPAFEVIKKEKIEAADVLKVLDLGGSVATQIAMSALLKTDEIWTAMSAQNPAELRRINSIGLAIMGAGCDLGRDCSSDSFSSLLDCAITGVCDGDIYDKRHEAISEADWAVILKKRNIIVESLKSKDISLLPKLLQESL
jgi:hypothetical protein